MECGRELCMVMDSGMWVVRLYIQWNPSKVDTIGTRIFVCYSEVSIAQGFRCSRA